jgi:hypothetical protein
MKIGERLRKIIGTVAPKIGGALGGPLGGIAGKMVRDALGVETDDAALDVLQTDPEALLKVKQAEIDFDKRLAELGIDLEKIHQEDRDSARRREMAVGDYTPKVLAYLLTIGFFGTLAALLYFGLPMDGRDVIMVMIGSLGTAWVATVNYYFGSSSGSAAKTNLLARNGHE